MRISVCGARFIRALFSCSEFFSAVFVRRLSARSSKSCAAIFLYIDVLFFIYREWGKVYAPCCLIELLIIAPCEVGLVYIRMLLRTPSIFDAG